MTTAAVKTTTVVIPLIVTAVLAIAGWASYFFAQQEASEYQQQVEEMVSGNYTKDEMQATLIAEKTSEIDEALDKRAKAALVEKTESKIKKEMEKKAKAAAKQQASSAPPPKYNKLIMAEREKALKEKKEAQSRIGSVLKEKESVAKQGEQLKQQLAQASADIEKLKQNIADLRRQESDRFQNLRQQLEKELKEKQITISQLQDSMTVVNVTAEILFSSGSATIKPKGQKVLNLIAETLNEHPNRMISIEGHTDDVPVAADMAFATNWELSSARSAAAVRYLENRAGVEATRMQVVGHGQNRPVESNETPEGRATNRRIEIILLPPRG